MGLSPFYTQRPGQHQSRVENPAGFNSPDGEASLILGSDPSGYFRRFKVGDKVEVFQSNTVDAAAKILKFKSRIRGPSKVPALSSAGENFGLADGQTLIVKIDEGLQQIVTFNTADFVDILNATAAEVIAVLNANLQGAVAYGNGLGNVAIKSNRTGRFSRVEIVGGTANAALIFEELAWNAKLLLGGVIINTVELWPGRVVDFSQWAANLSGAGSPVEIRFVLELVAK
jgi:hypothetical protein